MDSNPSPLSRPDWSDPPTPPPVRSSGRLLAFLVLTMVAMLTWARISWPPGHQPPSQVASQAIVAMASATPTPDHAATPDYAAAIPCQAAQEVAAAERGVQLRPSSQALKTRRLARPTPTPTPTPELTPEAPPVRPEIRPQLPELNYPRSAARDSQQPFEAPPPLAVAALPRASQFLARAQSASADLDKLVQRRAIEATFSGTGMPGEMVEMNLENRSNKTVQIRLVPGMSLQPPTGQKVQPLLVEEEQTITLAPGQRWSGPLRTYCMNSRVPAPEQGEAVAYRYNSRPDVQSQAAARVLRAVMRLESQQKLHPIIPYRWHRQAVIQISVWKIMGQLVDETRLRAAMGPGYFDPEVRQGILAEVDLALQEARVGQ